MTMEDPLRKARQRYLRHCAIAMAIVIAAASAGTWAMAQAPQLGNWRVLIVAVFWSLVLCTAWILRRYYLRLDAGTMERYRL